jgi:nitroreductase
MTDMASTDQQILVREVIRMRHSEPVPFDPQRPLAEAHLGAILEAAHCARTAHNMRNFEIIIVDHPTMLAALGRARGGTSEEFIRENSHHRSESFGGCGDGTLLGAR